jgi:hypothetical protein
MLIPDPICTSSRRLKADPNRVSPYTLNEDARRMKLRTLTLDPT